MSRVQIIELEPKVMRRDSLFREMCRGLLFLVVMPLRLIARRHHPDYERIAELELDCGLREPTEVEKLVVQFDDPELTAHIGCRNVEHSVAPRAGDPLRDGRADCWAQAKALLDACEGRRMTRGEMAAWEMLNERIDQLDVKISQRERRSNSAALAQLDAAAERKAELASFSHRIAEGMRKAELGEWAEVRYVDGESVVLPATPETEAELRKRTADYERGQDEARAWLRGLDDRG